MPVQTDSNRTLVSLVKEVTYGTTPSNPAWRPLRIKGASLSYTPKSDTSKELRSDRNVPDLIRLGFEAGGQIPMETSWGALDDLIEGAAMSAWVVRGAYAENVTAGGTITTVTSTDIDVTAQTFVVNDIYRTWGFTNAANNGVHVAQATSGAGTLVTSGGLVAETPPVGARIKRVGTAFGSGVLSISGSTLVRSGGSWITDGYVAGEWIKLGSSSLGAAFQFATAADNGWVRIASVTALVLTLDRKPTGWADDAGTGKTIAVFQGDYIRNGVTPNSYAIEEQLQDLAVPEYHVYNGMRVGTLVLGGQSQSIMDAQATLMGATMTPATVRTAGSTDLPVAQGEVLNTSSNVGRIAENGAPITAGPNYVMSSEITLDNTLRRQNAVGFVGSIGIGLGRCNVTGKLTTYYGDKTFLDKLLNSTQSSFDQIVQSSDGTWAMLVDIPLVKYATGGTPNVPGIDTDRTSDLTFQGLLHPTLGYTIHMQRFAAIN